MSTWEKAFDTFQWENRSQSTNTPLDATHLNKVNDALNVIDDRVIELQSADADIEEEIAGKQDVLTFDDVPTDGSNNPVKSNGIYDALNGKVDKNGTDRLMTADEGTKLAGIAAGAQVNVLEGVQVNGSDLSITNKKVNVDITGKADKVTDAVSGDIATLTVDGGYADSGVALFADKTVGFAPVVTCDNAIPINAKKVTAKIVAQQDLHGLPFPYVGGAYKNKFDKDNQNVFTGFIETFTHTFTSSPDGLYKTAYINCIPNTTYTISKVAGKTFRVADSAMVPADGVEYINTNANHTGTSITFTTSANAQYLAVLYWSSANQDVLTPDELAATLQIEIGSSPTSFAPYSNICPISGFSAVEVTQKDDADNPTVTETHEITLSSTNYGGSADNVGNEGFDFGEVDLGTLTYQKGGTDDKAFRTNSLIGVIMPVQDWSTDITTARCEQYAPDTGQHVYLLHKDATFGVNIQGTIYFYDKRFENKTATEIKTALSGVKLIYPLATPTTANITPVPIQMLKGKNVMSADSGDIEVEYTYDRIGDLADRVKALEDA